MNAALMLLAAAALALLASMGASLMSVNSMASRLATRAESTMALDAISVKLASLIPLERGNATTRVEWPADEGAILTCDSAAAFCSLASAVPGVQKARIFVCPVSAQRAGMESLDPGLRQGAFYKAQDTVALTPNRPVAFVVEVNSEKVARQSAQESAAVEQACSQLATALLPADAPAPGESLAQALRETGVRSWRVLTVLDVLQAQGSSHVKPAVATPTDLASVPAPARGELRLVKSTGRLMRFDGSGWASATQPAPVDMSFIYYWDANKTVGQTGPNSGNDIYMPIPETRLADGSTVPPFKVGMYEARYLRTNGVGAIWHDGSREQGAAEPQVATGYTWTQAKAACESVNAKLPSLSQWLALATRAAQHAGNWPSGVVGSGQMIGGASSLTSAAQPVVASRDFAVPFYGLPDTAPESRRTFNIYGVQTGSGVRNNYYYSSGVVASLWDLGGNAAEWVDWTPDVGILPAGDPSKDFCAWGEPCGSAKTEELLPAAMRPPVAGVPGGWLKATSAQAGLATNNVSGVDGCTGPCAEVAAVAVGGSAQSAAGGVFTFDTRWGRSYSSPFIGFRCVKQVDCSAAAGGCAVTTSVP